MSWRYLFLAILNLLTSAFLVSLNLLQNTMYPLPPGAHRSIPVVSYYGLAFLASSITLFVTLFLTRTSKVIWTQRVVAFAPWLALLGLALLRLPEIINLLRIIFN